MRIPLDGNWELFVIPPAERFSEVAKLSAYTPVSGAVPGNLELDLWRAGFGGDPLVGLNAKEYWAFENHDFWYRRTVECDFTGEAELVLEGVDLFAEIFFNGEKVGSCENALIPHRFKVNCRETNILAIRIISAEISARKYPAVAGTLAHGAELYSSIYTRRAAHVTGWDIFPRLSLGGLWKSVYLERRETPFYFHDLWLQTRKIDRENDQAVLRLFYHFAAGEESLQGCTLKFRMVCGESVWEKETPAYFTNGTVNFVFNAPKLWYPRAYGEQNLYELSAELRTAAGTLLTAYTTTCGIRSVELLHTEDNLDGQGKFSFIVNGQPVRICGSSHVPFDALHSRDGQRMEKVLELFDDLRCNMIRCWGGGVYESDEFYDWCDRKGILVWQDFMFACEYYPQNETFYSLIRPEVEAVVKRLRRHPSLALWCGDNEVDQSAFFEGLPLKMNRLSREIIPQIVAQHDPGRPYLASSPYIPSEMQGKYDFAEAVERIPEVHLWGNREFFKLPFYADLKMQFISETGWIGAPSLTTMKEFFAGKEVSVDEHDPVWDFHSGNQFGLTGVNHYRATAIAKALQEYFDCEPQNVPEFVRQSQIFQAEAFKFQIETVRLSKICTGILWWNAIDGWPQSSDAVVDYYFRKKLAYYYIKRSQNPFLICCSEPDPWDSQIVALNDSCELISGSFTVTDKNGRELLAGEYSIPPFSRRVLGQLRSRRGGNELWLIKWENDGVTGCNHYISGNRFMDLSWYMEQLPHIAALDNAFDADKLGE